MGLCAFREGFVIRQCIDKILTCGELDAAAGLDVEEAAAAPAVPEG